MKKKFALALTFPLVLMTVLSLSPPDVLAAPVAGAASEDAQGIQNAQKFMNDLLNSVGRLQFKASIRINSESKGPLGLEKLLLKARTPLSSAISYDVNKDVQLTLGEADLMVIAQLQLTNQKIKGHLEFQRNNAKAPLNIALQAAHVKKISWRLDSVEWEMEGLEKEVSKVTISGGCELQQEMVNFKKLAGKPGYQTSVDWEKTDCEYKMVYNKETKQVAFQFLYQSDNSDSGETNKVRP